MQVANTTITISAGDHILPPQIVLQPRPVSVQYGQSASLTCSVVGHPDPNILWYKDGCSHSIDSLSTVTGENGSTSSTLYLNHLATLLQAGEYYCTAYNLNENTNMTASSSSNRVEVKLTGINGLYSASKSNIFICISYGFSQLFCVHCVCVCYLSFSL